MGHIGSADCAASAFYHLIKVRLGSAEADVMITHMLACIVYRVLKFKVEYQALGAKEHEQRFRVREIQFLQRKAARLGLTLSPQTASLQAVSYHARAEWRSTMNCSR